MVLVVSGYIYIFLASVYVLFGRRYRQGQPWSSASRAPVQGRNCFGSTSSFANRDRGDLSLSSGPVPCPSVAALLISLLTSEIAAEIIQNSTEFYRICRCRSPLQSSVRSSLSFLGTLALSTQ
ncbi:hypothetical protein DVH24_024494 [Malus domestica]|uniref:Uncharacterized protein n=1 Tax=Malus domestica TaxID=3750 RepID=A0A498JGY9_MALDO|nr:hypothetical protein DVH24_024494 [Malus domestica]